MGQDIPTTNDSPVNQTAGASVANEAAHRMCSEATDMAKAAAKGGIEKGASAGEHCEGNTRSAAAGERGEGNTKGAAAGEHCEGNTKGASAGKHSEGNTKGASGEHGEGNTKGVGHPKYETKEPAFPDQKGDVVSQPGKEPTPDTKKHLQPDGKGKSSGRPDQLTFTDIYPPDKR